MASAIFTAVGSSGTMPCKGIFRLLDPSAERQISRITLASEQENFAGLVGMLPILDHRRGTVIVEIRPLR
jgi:hypothetical protein